MSRNYPITIIIFTVCIMLSLSLVWSQEVFVGRVSHLEGKIYFQNGRSLDWAEGYVNSPVQEGDRIWTDLNARAELQLVDAVLIRMFSDSKIDIVRMSMKGTIVKIWLGNVFMRITSDMSREKSPVIETPEGNIKFLSKGLYRIDVSQENIATISTYDGVIETKYKEAVITCRKGEIIQINEQGQVSPTNKFSIPESDEFSMYNSKRDERLVQPESSKYIPDSLRVGVHDLDYYGIWIYEPAYGYCWQPIIYAGWAPYRFGRWIWIHPWGWTWVSYDPWGWAPYHYGYWYYSSYYGWMWKPDRYYGPHWVAWHAHSTSIGWVPLHPKDVSHVHWNANNYHWQAQISDPTNARLSAEIEASTFISREDFQKGTLIYGREQIVPVNNNELKNWETRPATETRLVRQPRMRIPTRIESDKRLETIRQDKYRQPIQDRNKLPGQRRDPYQLSEKPPQKSSYSEGLKKGEEKKKSNQKSSSKDPVNKPKPKDKDNKEVDQK